jgi:hypothetical protein
LENKSKISNSQRIFRLISRMCQAEMNVIMKLSDDSPTGIRGALRSVKSIKGRRVIYVDKISERGLLKIEGSKTIKAEVLGMPSRVMFVSQILKRIKSGVFLSIPRQLISVERRQNTRYPTTWNHMAYFVPDDWKAQREDLASPPVLSDGNEICSWISLADLSLGGACLLTHFRSILNYLEAGQDKIEGKIIFPMIDPIQSSVIVRWQKKTVNRIVENGIERARLDYRFGIEFNALDEDMILKIRQFMRRLSMAQAI